MPERGPLPSPTARRRNKRNESGRYVDVARPSMPGHLKPEAKAEWRRIVPELEQMGVITKVDRALLIRYCTVWADWCELDAELKKTGVLIRGRLNGVVRNPLWILRSDAEATLSDLMKQLCCSPNARLRAGVSHEAPEEPEDEAAPTAIAKYRARLAE